LDDEKKQTYSSQQSCVPTQTGDARPFSAPDQARPAQENNIDQSQTSPSSTEGSTVIATDSLTAIKTKIQENIRQQVQDGTASPAQIDAHSQRSLFGG
jgi:hypothetical protein